MTKYIKEIQVITQLGPRCFVKGIDFDYVEEARCQEPAGTVMVLYKAGRLATIIHPYVPVVIDYETDI